MEKFKNYNHVLATMEEIKQIVNEVMDIRVISNKVYTFSYNGHKFMFDNDRYLKDDHGNDLIIKRLMTTQQDKDDVLQYISQLPPVVDTEYAAASADATADLPLTADAIQDVPVNSSDGGAYGFSNSHRPLDNLQIIEEKLRKFDTANGRIDVTLEGRGIVYTFRIDYDKKKIFLLDGHPPDGELWLDYPIKTETINTIVEALERYKNPPSFYQSYTTPEPAPKKSWFGFGKKKGGRKTGKRRRSSRKLKKRCRTRRYK